MASKKEIKKNFMRNSYLIKYDKYKRFYRDRVRECRKYKWGHWGYWSKTGFRINIHVGKLFKHSELL